MHAIPNARTWGHLCVHNQHRGAALAIEIDITTKDMMTEVKETLAMQPPINTAIMRPNHLDRTRREMFQKMTTVQEISPRMTSADVIKTITDSLCGPLTTETILVAASGPRASLFRICLPAEERRPPNLLG